MRKLFVVPLAAAMLFSHLAWAATVHKCKNSEGVMIYQETPCARETQEVSSWSTKFSGSNHDFALSGFQGLLWGAGDDAILAKFGNAVTRLQRPETYYNAHANLEITKYNYGNTVLKASFQMNNQTNKLSKVLLSKFASSVRSQSFIKEYQDLLALMTQKMGSPIRLDGYKYKWIVGSTAIELDYLYQANIMENLTVLYKPNS
jgi:hypothetical protein